MRYGIFAAVLGAVMLIGAFAESASAAHLIMYRDINYGRDARNLFNNTYSFNQVLENFNDEASSVKVNGGTWELCEHDGYRGRCIIVTRDIPDLRYEGFNDMASSARLLSERNNDVPRDYRDRSRDDRGDRGGWRDNDRGWSNNDNNGGWGRGGIEIYEHINYGGARRTVDGNVRSLGSMGFNDVISSIRISSGVWEFCEHDNYEGRCITYDRNVSWVGDQVNDQISSIRRIR